MTPRVRFALVVASVACLGACVGPRQYRFTRNQPGCFPSATGGASVDPMAGDPAERRNWPSVDCRNALYKVGFIEFDDQGKPLDPSQQDKVLRLIANEKARAPDHKIVTVLYVHGWKNNAAQAAPGANMKDVERFESALTELGYRAANHATGEPGIPVVGVYIGWRGKSLMGPSWFTFVSLWSRRNAANRVGSPALAETVTRVVTATKATNNGSPGATDTSRVVLVGHSFGARVLEHAIDAGQLTLYDEPQAGVPVTPAVDLVLYVNSANDSRISMKRISELRTRPLVLRHPDFDAAACAAPQAANEPTCRAYPYIVTIMSRGDQATKLLLPIANTLNLDNRASNIVVPPGSFADKSPSPGAFRRHSAGHMRFLQSHDVQEISCPARGQPPCRLASCEFAFKTWADDLCYAVQRRAPADGKPVFNTTASWVVSVDTTVMKDHGDIWNLSMISMLGQLMAPRGFFERGTKPLELQLAESGNR
ncbi:MAG: hypothetical protein ABMA15_03420 [Vicinamibacterales bacterium]